MGDRRVLHLPPSQLNVLFYLVESRGERVRHCGRRIYVARKMVALPSSFLLPASGHAGDLRIEIAIPAAEFFL